jgi:hypothetical protein
MEQTLKQQFWKIIKWFIVLFFLMLLFRIIYGYIASDVSENNDNSISFFSNVENLRKNYASEKKFATVDVGKTAEFASSQKYEKTATVKSKSEVFEKNEKDIKDITKSFAGVIQYEQNTGNKGSREIHLSIGVDPEKFDSFYAKLQSVGVIKSTEITKVDKTNEYRQLNAKKASLEKMLTSLNELKLKAGPIGDFISLNDKILEIETQMQDLGVELGNFDAENEFCTVKFSLYEGATEKKMSFLFRFRVALEWTIKYYAVLVLALLAIAIAIYLGLVIVQKFKILSTQTAKK